MWSPSIARPKASQASFSTAKVWKHVPSGWRSKVVHRYGNYITASIRNNWDGVARERPGGCSANHSSTQCSNTRRGFVGHHYSAAQNRKTALPLNEMLFSSIEAATMASKKETAFTSSSSEMNIFKSEQKDDRKLPPSHWADRCGRH